MRAQGVWTAPITQLGTQNSPTVALEIILTLSLSLFLLYLVLEQTVTNWRDEEASGEAHKPRARVRSAKKTVTLESLAPREQNAAAFAQRLRGLLD